MNPINKLNINGTTYDIENTVTSINGQTGAIAASDIAQVLTAAGYKLTDTIISGALTYKGTIGSTGATVTALPAAHAVGDVYVVKVAGTYAGKAVEAGDYIICNTAGTTANDAHWDVLNGENQVSNKAATLSWGNTSTLATVDGTDITVKMPSNPNTNTTYKFTIGSNTLGDSNGTSLGSLSSQAAAANGTALSLVTTGEKATWNAKTSNTGTVTSVATGAGLTGGTITGSGTIKANLNSETSLGTIGTTSKLYAVGVDANGKLAVNVPWTDNNTWVAASSSVAGYVPAATKGKFLHSNASTGNLEWVDDNNTTYTLAGLMGSSAKGGTTQPIYWNGSAFANTTYTLGKSVPSNAVFTDTKPTYSYDSNTLTLTLGNFVAA